MYDPANPGRTITDIDRIEGGTLWEEKSASLANNPRRWVQRQVLDKFGKYLEARQYLPGYEDAPIGFDFTAPHMDPGIRADTEGAIQGLRAANPDVPIRVQWSGQ